MLTTDLGLRGYFVAMSNITLIIVIVVAVVVVAAIVVVGYRMAQQKRTAQLRDQFGPEYDRALDQSDSQREAESELRDRSKRHEELELRSLDSSEREDFEAEVTQRYREARRIAQANQDGNVDTEDLRQAVTSYRSLVQVLLADDGDRNRDSGTQTEHDNNKEHDNQVTEREAKA